MAIEIITSVLRPAAATTPVGPYDLTDLATVRDELSIPAADTSSDAFLQRAITQGSIQMANYANRVFPVEGIQDLVYIEQDAYPYQVPGGIFPLQLTRWPLTDDAVMELTGNTTLGSAVIANLVLQSADTGFLVVGTPVSGAGIPVGARIVNLDAPGNTMTLDSAATASASAVALSTGLVVIQNTTPGSPKLLVEGRDYKIDRDKGWLINLNAFTGLAQKWPAMPVTVQYAAGYDEIPADLVNGILRLVTFRTKARGRDPALKAWEQPGIGRQEWWVGTLPGLQSGMPTEVTGILDNYRVPVTA